MYPSHVFITTAKQLTLYIEDRNDISGKVQKLHSDYFLMELIYVIFAFAFVIQGACTLIHMFVRAC